MTRVFIYDGLMTHELQREIWGEIREGSTMRLIDYELKLWPETFASYIERVIGESVVGKVYELTDEQIKKTDQYYTEKFERISIKIKDKPVGEVYIKATGEAKPKKKSKIKKGKKAKKK